MYGKVIVKVALTGSPSWLCVKINRLEQADRNRCTHHRVSVSDAREVFNGDTTG